VVFFAIVSNIPSFGPAYWLVGLARRPCSSAVGSSRNSVHCQIAQRVTSATQMAQQRTGSGDTSSAETAGAGSRAGSPAGSPATTRQAWGITRKFAVRPPEFKKAKGLVCFEPPDPIWIVCRTAFSSTLPYQLRQPPSDSRVTRAPLAPPALDIS